MLAVCMWKAGEVVFGRGESEGRRTSDLLFTKGQLLEISDLGTEQKNLESDFLRHRAGFSGTK